MKRLNARGLAGLEDRPRPGGHPTSAPEQVAGIIAAARTTPAASGLPFAAWTLDRMVAHLGEARRITMKRTRLAEVLRAEGLRWREQEPWFGERVDPRFAEEMGASSRLPTGCVTWRTSR